MVRVIRAGLVVVRLRVVVVLQELKAALVSSATLCVPFRKLNSRVSPTTKVLLLAQVW